MFAFEIFLDLKASLLELDSHPLRQAGLCNALHLQHFSAHLPQASFHI